MTSYTFVIIAWVIWSESDVLPFTETEEHAFTNSTVVMSWTHTKVLWSSCLLRP